MDDDVLLFDGQRCARGTTEREREIVVLKIHSDTSLHVNDVKVNG